MSLKVRVADLVEARTLIKSASVDEEHRKVEITNENCKSKSQMGVGESSHDSELHQFEDVQGRGVLYCEIDSENHMESLDNIDGKDTINMSHKWGNLCAPLVCHITVEKRKCIIYLFILISKKI